MSEKNGCCNGGLKLVFSCSGASDTAEIGDRAARKVNRTGDGKMYCLAGVGGDVEMIMNNTKAAEQIVAVDGCDTDCAARLLRKAGFHSFGHLRVTDFGFVKGSSPVTEDAVDRIQAEILTLLRVGSA